MRIMTSNIWGDFFGNEVEIREDQLFSIYKKYFPDVIGFQEVTRSWYKGTLFKNLSESYILIGTELYDNFNFVPIAIKKGYDLLAKGYERLTNTPDYSKSVTWAVVEKDGNRFGVCNTHFWWMQGNEAAETKEAMSRGYAGKAAYWTKEQHTEQRNQNARQITALMQYIANKYSCPVFAFGDMNTTISFDVFKIYKDNAIRHLFDLAEEKDTVCSIHGNPKRGEDGRYHGQKPTDDYTSSIDHIVGLGNSFSVSQYRIVQDQDALDASDHSPVYSDINFI